MEKYRKGKNVEEEMTLPTDVPENALWLRVRGGTKINAVLEPGLRQLNDGRCVVWSGSGAATRKAVSCAELCKQRCSSQGLHQVTRLAWLRCDEHWEPLVEGLDELVVRRRVPVVHLLLSPSQLDSHLSGYQPPNNTRPLLPTVLL